MRAYDTVVIGGGPSGVPATVQTARLGARTLLVEKNAGLGGTTTSANVAFPGLFHAWGEQVIGGIGWELVCRTVELSGEELPDLRDDEHPSGPAVPRRGPGTAGARHSRRRPVARSGLERPFVATFLYRLGRFSFRRRRLVALLWVAVLAACAFAAARATAAPKDGPRQERVKESGPGIRAVRAERRLEWSAGATGVPEKL
ncbi:FAD-dependent oxidoreductase [Streptomyces sp. NBC_00057]|uniref:FAD-dependent oxidoreductase n=1 Tax=Streptomyces sp. NBC_00057 TaxID=2975634 RepID=UPI00386E4B45